MQITHQFVSTVPDDDDPDKVGPDEWNDAHVISGRTGSSFPGSPGTNDLFYRTDRGLDYYYDGTQWLTVQAFRDCGINDFVGAATGSVTAGRWFPMQSLSPSDIWLVAIEIQSYAAALSGSAYWSFNILKGTAAESETSLGTPTSASDTSSNWTNHVQSVGALLSAGGSYNHIRVSMSKTGSPGNCNILVYVVYRLVG